MTNKQQRGATLPEVELIELCKGFGTSGNRYAVDHLNLKINQGEFFTFLGPSGCGKTTTLRMIAGFEHPSTGYVLLKGREVNGVPAHQRNVNTVFQSYALFPHLSVGDNVAFGLAVKGVKGAERQRRVQAALETVRMAHAIDRKPSSLSGGQQQRIALARAIVNEPSVLLLDEPFGALDLKLRREMQAEVKSLQRRLGITFIFVTHDQEEALTMSDRIAVMNNGVICQVGDPETIYERPDNRFTAGFIGEMNLLNAAVTHQQSGRWQLDAGGCRLPVDTSQPLTVGQSCTLAIRPEALSLLDTPADKGVTFRGLAQSVAYIGTDHLCMVQLENGESLKIRVPNQLYNQAKFTPGETVQVFCPDHAVHLFTH